MSSKYPDNSEVTICIEYYAEDEEGISSYFDEETCQKIYDDLESGNKFAWFKVKVFAKWKTIVGEPAMLGNCSHMTEEDFKNDETYLSLVDKAIANLYLRIDYLRSILV
jgi:hypothetical protein